VERRVGPAGRRFVFAACALSAAAALSQPAGQAPAEAPLSPIVCSNKQFGMAVFVREFKVEDKVEDAVNYGIATGSFNLRSYPF